MTSRLRIPLLGFIGFAGALHAQTSQPYVQTRTVAVPTSVAPPYRRIASGNFTGHLYPDVAFVGGGQTVLVAAPSLHRAIAVVGGRTDVNDVATLPGGGTSQRDALVLACTGGLFLWTIDGGTTQLATGGWGTATVGDVDNNGQLDIVGRNRFGTAVFVHLRGTATTQTISYTGETVYEVLCLNWDGIPAAEICVSTSQRLHIRGLAPSTVDHSVSVANTGPGLLAKVTVASAEFAVWLTKVAGTPVLTTKGFNSTFTAPCNVANPVGMTAGDVQTDGLDDLAITGSDSSLIHVVLNRWTPALPSGPLFPTQISYTLDIGGSTSGGNTATAWVGDFDADGDGDFLLPVSANGNVVLARQGVPVAPCLTLGMPTTLHDTATGSVWTLHVAETSLQSLPASATHFDILLYESDTDATGRHLLPTMERWRFARSQLGSIAVPETAFAANVRAHFGFIVPIAVTAETAKPVARARGFAMWPFALHNGITTWLTSASNWSDTPPPTILPLPPGPSTGDTTDPPPPPPLPPPATQPPG